LEGTIVPTPFQNIDIAIEIPIADWNPSFDPAPNYRYFRPRGLKAIFSRFTSLRSITIGLARDDVWKLWGPIATFDSNSEFSRVIQLIASGTPDNVELKFGNTGTWEWEWVCSRDLEGRILGPWHPVDLATLANKARDENTHRWLDSLRIKALPHELWFVELGF
jgi:hypothetical protein